MERRGFEPLTLTLPVSRATNCANAPCEEVIQLSKPLGAGAAPLQIRYSIEFAGTLPTPLRKIYLIVKAFSPATSSFKFNIQLILSVPAKASCEEVIQLSKPLGRAPRDLRKTLFKRHLKSLSF